MKKIVLLNVYGSKNIGDEAINIVALELISQVVASGTIYSIGVQKRENHTYNSLTIEHVLSPYGTAINQGKKTTTVMKLINFGKVISTSLFITMLYRFFLSKEFSIEGYEYIKNIQEADYIINMGGGYLRTKQPLTDFFGLSLTVLPIFIGKLFNKPQLFLPMSFGNFASRFHEQLAFQAITNSTFFARDEITFNVINNAIKDKKSGILLKLFPDLALLLATDIKIQELEDKIKSNYIVLSAREWLSATKQHHYESSLAKLIEYIYKKYKLKTVFLAMATNSIEDDDRNVFDRIYKQLTNKNICTLSVAKSPSQVLNLLQKAHMAVCTRMHASILSSLVCTPFITIQYEHKTLGFMKTLNISRFNIKIEEVTFESVKRIFDEMQLSQNYKDTYALLNKKREFYKKKRIEFTKELSELLT